MAVTWNPADKSSEIELSNGNLTAKGMEQASNAQNSVRATISKSSGKWYWEVYPDKVTFELTVGVGSSAANINGQCGDSGESWGYTSHNGLKRHNGTEYSYGNEFHDEIIGVALDMDAGKIWFALNNVWQASGDPANGTGEAFSGLSGSLFPMGSCGENQGSYDYDQQTIRPDSNSQTYSPPSGFSPLQSAPSGTNLFNGKVRIKNNVSNLFDGKANVDILAVNSFNGKAKVKGATTKLFNGRAEVIGWKADKLDGKAEVTGWAADLVDGKVAVANLSSDLFNGKARICLTPANIFDGKAKLYGIATNILDGKALVEIEGATNYLDGRVAVRGWKADLLDGKVEVRGSFEGDVDLSILNIEALIGARGDTSLLAPEVDSLASIGTSCLASYKLSKLQALSYIGAKAEGLLPRLEVDSQGIEWILANGAVKVPGIKILSNAKIEELAQGVIRLGTLRISSNALHGSFVEGLLSLPRLHVLGGSVNGAACEGAILLPCLSISASGYELITAIGDIDLGLLDIFAKSRSLTDETCWILKYND